MIFTLKGSIAGYLCNSFHEGLSNAVVKVYLPDTTEHVESKTKYTLNILNASDIRAKEERLLGAGTADEWGSYTIELAANYNGGPVSFDVVVTQVPRQKVKINKSVQFTLTTLQPVWREQENEKSYRWDYCLPYSFWGKIRTSFDAWMICGHVKASKDGAPMAGVKVHVYDADWIQDDFLGTAVTDDSGYFRVDYGSADFKKTFLTPFINVETPFSLIPGPGVYFKVTSRMGEMLYKEGRKEGKLKERRNIPNCYSVELYI